jgi:hypothetical protein
MQLAQRLQQGDHHLVPHTVFTERAAGLQAGAQVTLQAILQDDMQLRTLIHGCPKGYNAFCVKVTVQLNLLMHLGHKICSETVALVDWVCGPLGCLGTGFSASGGLT